MGEHSDLGLDIRFQSHADNSGSEHAADGIHKVGKHAHDAAEEFKELGYSAEHLKEMMLELLAFAEVIAMWKEGTEEALKLEKAWRGLDDVAKKNGHSSHEQREEVEKLAHALGQLSGTATPEVVRAVSDQVMKTNDLKESLSRVALANDIAQKKGIELSEALAIVEGATMGIARGSKELKAQVLGVNDQQERQRILIEYLEKNYRGYTKTLDDHASKVDRAKHQWDEFREMLGKKVLSVFGAIVDIFDKAPAAAIAAVKKIGAGFTFLLDVGKNTVEGVKLIFTKGFTEAATVSNAANAASLAKMDARLKEIDKDLVERLKHRTEHSKEVLDKLGEEGIHADKVHKEKLLKEEKDFEAERLRAAVAAAKTIVEKQEAEEALLSYMLAKELEDRKGYEKKTEEEKEQIRARFRLLQLAAEKKLGEELGRIILNNATDWQKAREKEMKERMAGDLAVTQFEAKLAEQRLRNSNSIEAKYKLGILAVKAEEEKTLAELLKKHVSYEKAVQLAHEQSEEAMAQVTKEKTRAEFDLNVGVFNGIMGMYTELFGESKELAYAQTIINAAAGIMKIWATTDGYTAIAMTAIEVAAGIAALAKIEKTQYNQTASGAKTPAGFDSPSNDYAAYVGGGTWARHMVQRFASGATAGFSDGLLGMGGGRNVVNNTTDNRRTTNVYMHGVGLFDVQNRGSLTRLKRALDSIDQGVERRLTVGRAS